MDVKTKSLIKIHVAVLLFGITGLFGKFIALPATLITLGRVFFSSSAFFVVFKIKNVNYNLKSKKDYILICITGIILALHWSSFFQSIKVSTVAIALLTFASYPIFVTFIEPIMFKEKLKKRDICCAIIMFLGVILIVPKFKLDNNLTIGFLWGMLASMTWSYISLMNRKFSDKYEGYVIAFYEQGVATLVLLPFLFFIKPVISFKSILFLFILGVIFTGFAHTLVIDGMKLIRAQTTAIIMGIETVYGIIFAFIFLSEVPSIKELIGGMIIMGTAFYSSIMARREP